MSTTEGDKKGLVFLSTSDFKVTGAYEVPSNLRVTSIDWASQTRVVVTVGFFREEGGGLRSAGNLYVADADGDEFELVFYGRIYGVPWGRASADKHSAGVARVVSRLREDPNHVLVEVNREFWLRQSAHGSKLYAMNLDNGDRRLVADGPGSEWATLWSDVDGEHFVGRIDADDLTTQYFRYRKGEKEWVPIGKSQDSSVSWASLSVVATSEGLLVVLPRKDGARCLTSFEPQGFQPNATIMCADNVDIGSIVPSFDGSTAIAVQLDGSQPTLQFLNSGHADEARLKQIYETFRAAGQFVLPVSSSDDGRAILLRAWSDQVPAEFYLYRADENRAQYLMASHDWMNPDEAASQRVLRVRARDGLEFEAIYTRPVRDGDAPLPLVVMPHGGPFGVHDRWGWDSHAQALASRGYSVLQPNFRGSGGYGRAHLEAGRHELGQGMVFDIIDATLQVQQEGLADDRVCIYGASYGGFAAVTAAVLQPELFKCVITLSGLYDMNRSYREAWMNQRSGQKKWINRYFGSRSIRKKQFPGTRIDDILAPVLVLHGESDFVVPIDHAKALVDDLQDADKAVTVEYFEGEEHSFALVKNRTRVLELIDEFLSTHLRAHTEVEETADSDSDGV